MVQIALTMAPGVSGDECEAFSLVLDQVPGVEFVHVGSTPGRVNGSGRTQFVDHTFAQVRRPDVVLVPGGLGTARAARDVELLGWLRDVAPSCRWLVGSSTGTVLLAAAGLLEHGRPVATHWLAGSLLADYGAEASTDRIVEHDGIITCEGHVTAAEVALLLTARLAGAATARRILEDLPRRRRPPTPRMGATAGRRSTRRDEPWWRGWIRLFLGRHAARGPRAPANVELEVSDWIELDAVEMDVLDP